MYDSVRKSSNIAFRKCFRNTFKHYSIYSFRNFSKDCLSSSLEIVYVIPPSPSAVIPQVFLQKLLQRFSQKFLQLIIQYFLQIFLQGFLQELPYKFTRKFLLELLQFFFFLYFNHLRAISLLNNFAEGINCQDHAIIMK